MRNRLGAPTKAQVRRFDALQRMGCIVCRLHFAAYRAPDVHHILSGGRRISHDRTIPLCPEHHRVSGSLGPSLADGSKVFEAKWGTQEWLHEQTEKLLAGHV